MAKINDLTKAELTRLKATLMSDRAIANLYDVSEQTIVRKRQEWGIAGIPKRKYAEIDRRTLRQLRDKELGDKEIAAIYGVSSNYVRSLRSRYGLVSKKARDFGNADANLRRTRLLPKINSMRKAGERLSDIATKLGIPKGTIYQWAHRGYIEAHNGSTEGNPRRKEYAEARHNAKRRIYDAIVKYKHEHDGNTPPVSHIVACVAISTTSVRGYLRELSRDGKIRIISKATQPLQVEVTGAQWIPPAGVRVIRVAKEDRRSLPPPNAQKRKRTIEGVTLQYCECGEVATHKMTIHVAPNRKDGGLTESFLLLCDGCAQDAREMGERVSPLTHGDEQGSTEDENLA